MEKANVISASTPLHIQHLSKCSQISKDKTYIEKVPYASVVGSLMYTIVCTRFDIIRPIGLSSRHVENPIKTHWGASEIYF